MPGLHEYLLFIAAGLLLNITPGADMLYVISSAARHGAGRGVAGAFGVFAGILVHITLAAVGLSAVLAASPLAFMVVKYVGAIYLVFLGVRLLLARGHGRGNGASASEAGSPVAGCFEVFRGGVLINVLNPKIALFFLAFLPQFVDPSSSHRALAFITLGLTFNVTGTVVNCLMAYATCGVGRLPLARRVGVWAQRCVGVLFIGLGARLAVGR